MEQQFKAGGSSAGAASETCMYKKTHGRGELLLSYRLPICNKLYNKLSAAMLAGFAYECDSGAL